MNGLRLLPTVVDLRFDKVNCFNRAVLFSIIVLGSGIWGCAQNNSSAVPETTAHGSAGESPVQFVWPQFSPARLIAKDAQDGSSIPMILVLEMRTSHKATPAGGERDKVDWPQPRAFISRTIICREGVTFAPKSSELKFVRKNGTDVVFSGDKFEGVLVVAPGYEPAYVSDARFKVLTSEEAATARESQDPTIVVQELHRSENAVGVLESVRGSLRAGIELSNPVFTRVIPRWLWYESERIPSYVPSVEQQQMDRYMQELIMQTKAEGNTVIVK